MRAAACTPAAAAGPLPPLRTHLCLTRIGWQIDGGRRLARGLDGAACMHKCKGVVAGGGGEEAGRNLLVRQRQHLWCVDGPQAGSAAGIISVLMAGGSGPAWLVTACVWGAAVDASGGRVASLATHLVDCTANLEGIAVLLAFLCSSRSSSVMLARQRAWRCAPPAVPLATSSPPSSYQLEVRVAAAGAAQPRAGQQRRLAHMPANALVRRQRRCRQLAHLALQWARPRGGRQRCSSLCQQLVQQLATCAARRACSQPHRCCSTVAAHT